MFVGMKVIIENDGTLTKAVRTATRGQVSEAVLQELKSELQAQINSYPVVIDRSVFEKTREEKLDLKSMKKVVTDSPDKRIKNVLINNQKQK